MIFRSTMKRNLRVGLFGIGLDTYWPQFKGLKPRLESYVRVVEKKLARPGVEVVAEALAPRATEQEAAAAAERLAAHKPDLVAMDCMSYTPTTKAWVKGPLGVPALLAITATGRVLREMLD